MANPLERKDSDELLQPLIDESNEADVERVLTFLIQNHATPVIKAVVRQKIPAWNRLSDCYEDIHAEVVVRLLARLRQFKENPIEYCIWNFRDYTAASTDRVCSNYLRARYPNRCRLKNTILYLLTRDSSFFIKEDGGMRICGLSEWITQDQPLKMNKAILPDPANIRSKLRSGYQDASSLRHALKEVFKVSGEPLEVEVIVKIMATIFSVQDRSQKNEMDNADGNIFDLLSDNRSNPEKQVETIQYLRKMWSEICLLPVNQRAALLLNLKDPDGKDLLSLFPLTGIATFRKIASILELSLDQFAEIWKDIPLGDTKIGEILGVTRQQVINLRKSARERLIRRSKGG